MMPQKPYHSLQLIYRRVRETLRVFFAPPTPVWILWGRETSSKDTLKVLYAGGTLTKNYLINLLFDSPCVENYLGRKRIWKLLRSIKQIKGDYSFVALEASQTLRTVFQGKNQFFIPLWISSEIDILDEKPECFKNESLNSDLRRIKKNNLSFEVTKDLSHLRNFYWNMYCPYITKRHGNVAFVMRYEVMEHKFKTCELLLIKKGPEYIAGILLVYSKKGARLWSLGIKDGSREYINDGAVGALFYFSYLYLRQKGYEKINLGKSRPFLHDGVLRYKAKWDQKIIRADAQGLFVKPLLSSPGVKEFFINNPFIFQEKDCLNVALFIEENQLLGDKEFSRILKKYFLPGISKIFIYLFGESAGGVRGNVFLDFAKKVEIHSAEDLFKPTKKRVA